MEPNMDAVIQRILVPVDFSDASERAAKYAAALARRLNASLQLIHAVDAPALTPGPFEVYHPDTTALVERLNQDARARLTALAGGLDMPTNAISTEVRSGSAPESITNAALDYGADLVIMSTHGRTGLSHLLMGSVAERVIRAARCPVLVIRDCGQVHVHRPGAVEAAQSA